MKQKITINKCDYTCKGRDLGKGRGRGFRVYCRKVDKKCKQSVQGDSNLAKDKISLKNYALGKVKKETPKALLVDGSWLPKSAIEERLKVVYMERASGRTKKIPEGTELFIMRFPPSAGRRNSLSWAVEVEDGRVFFKHGLNAISW